MGTDKTDIVSAPHGKQQNIKMNLLKWINEGRSPYRIIYEMAEYLEEASAEPGFAQIVQSDIRSVYGVGLNEKPVISDELLELRERLSKLEGALKRQDIDEETQNHLKFAVEHHQRKIKALEDKLK